MFFNETNTNRLIEIATRVEKGFPGQHQYYKRFIAVLSYALDKEIDMNEVKDISNYIKKSTKMFSPLRANRFVLSSMIALHYKKPEQAVDRIIDHFEHLKQAGFKKANYLGMTSYCLDSLLFHDEHYDQMKQTGSYIDNLIDNALNTYNSMKDNHPWITGGDDYPLAVMIAHNETDNDAVEHVYETLTHLGLKKGNELQSLANILSLSTEDSDVICSRVTDMIEYARTKGYKVNRTMYPGIGLIGLLGEGMKYLDDVIEAASELKKIKKFKWLEKNLLFLFAVAIVATQVEQGMKNGVALDAAISITIEQLVMAQVAVMIGMIAATTAATSAAT